jgi:hypothetical protein
MLTELFILHGKFTHLITLFLSINISYCPQYDFVSPDNHFHYWVLNSELKKTKLIIQIKNISNQLQYPSNSWSSLVWIIHKITHEFAYIPYKYPCSNFSQRYPLCYHSSWQSKSILKVVTNKLIHYFYASCPFSKC